MRDDAAGLPRVHVESVGAGAPIVLLHGFAMHGGLFAPLLPALSRTHRVHVVDLPGHGRSAAVHAPDLSSMARAVDAAIDGDAPLTIVGWSLGGQVALQWSLLRESRIRRLVLVATTPSFVQRSDWPHAVGENTLARFGDELAFSYRLTLQRFLSLQVQGSDEGRATLAQLRARLFERGEPPASALADALALLRAADLRPMLQRIGAPTLVVAGERDALVPLAATTALAAALPEATHQTIRGAAHAPFLSHRAAFFDAVLPFVDG